LLALLLDGESKLNAAAAPALTGERKTASAEILRSVDFLSIMIVSLFIFVAFSSLL